MDFKDYLQCVIARIFEKAIDFKDHEYAKYILFGLEMTIDVIRNEMPALVDEEELVKHVGLDIDTYQWFQSLLSSNNK